MYGMVPAVVVERPIFNEPFSFASPKSVTLTWFRCVDHDIVGLHVPVNDAPGVGFLKRLPDLDGIGNGLRDGQGAPPELAAKRFAIDKLHIDEPASFEFAQKMHATNIGMIEVGGGFRFLQEPVFFGTIV